MRVNLRIVPRIFTRILSANGKRPRLLVMIPNFLPAQIALMNSAATDLIHVAQIESIRPRILLWHFRPKST
jgi:hypothetical protein